MLNRVKVHRLDGGVVHTNSLCPRLVPSGRKISRQEEDPAEVKRLGASLVLHHPDQVLDICCSRFDMFREMRELFEAEIAEHEQNLDEADPRRVHYYHRWT